MLPFEGTSPSLNGGWKSEVKPQNGPLKSESENKNRRNKRFLIHLPLHVTSFPVQLLSVVHILLALPCNSKPSSHLNSSSLLKVVSLPINVPFFGRGGKPQFTTLNVNRQTMRVRYDKSWIVHSRLFQTCQLNAQCLFLREISQLSNCQNINIEYQHKNGYRKSVYLPVSQTQKKFSDANPSALGQ